MRERKRHMWGGGGSGHEGCEYKISFYNSQGIEGSVS